MNHAALYAWLARIRPVLIVKPPLQRIEAVRFAEVIFCPKGLCFRVFLLAEF
nr:MAG TPA: hypothetical protein [Caudoviricetes sp.]